MRIGSYEKLGRAANLQAVVSANLQGTGLQSWVCKVGSANLQVWKMGSAKLDVQIGTALLDPDPENRALLSALSGKLPERSN